MTRPANTVGGDFYDILPRPDGTVIIMADARARAGADGALLQDQQNGGAIAWGAGDIPSLLLGVALVVGRVTARSTTPVPAPPLAAHV